MLSKQEANTNHHLTLSGPRRRLCQPHRQYVHERTERQQTVIQILKAARIAPSDIVGISAATSGRVSTCRLSSNGDIIPLSPETLGWDWRAHLGRPRQFCAPYPRWG